MTNLLPVPSVAAFGDWHLLVALFFVNFLGEGGVPFPLVMSGVMILIGYNVAVGHLSQSFTAATVSVLGSATGALTIYSVSQHLGPGVLRRLWRWLRLKPERLSRWEDQLPRLRLIQVAHFRLIPGLALPTSIAAGVASVPRRKFLGGVVLSETLWIGPLIIGGYLLGTTSFNFGDSIGMLPSVIIVVAVILLLVQVVRRLILRVFAAHN